MPVFHIRQGIKAGETVTLQAVRIIMGRDAHSNFQLPDESIDLAHASLENRGGRWILQDLGSPDGTWLNEEQVDKPRRIFNGDVLKLGKIRIEVQGVGNPRDVLPRAKSPGSEAQPMPAQVETGYHTLLILILVGLIAVGVIIGILWIGGLALTRPVADTPPSLKVLLSQNSAELIPGETLSFYSEAQDNSDLDRVEFWVDDILETINKPTPDDSLELRTLHEWSANEPGVYTLSIIAYDTSGQASVMSKIQVTVANK